MFRGNVIPQATRLRPQLQVGETVNRLPSKRIAHCNCIRTHIVFVRQQHVVGGVQEECQPGNDPGYDEDRYAVPEGGSRITY